MRRHVLKVNEDVMKVTPKNDDESNNKGRKWHYNKNVPLWKRKEYRGKQHKENVMRMT